MKLRRKAYLYSRPAPGDRENDMDDTLVFLVELTEFLKQGIRIKFGIDYIKDTEEPWQTKMKKQYAHYGPQEKGLRCYWAIADYNGITKQENFPCNEHYSKNCFVANLKSLVLAMRGAAGDVSQELENRNKDMPEALAALDKFRNVVEKKEVEDGN